MNKKETIIVILFAIAAVILILIAENKKKQKVILNKAEDTPGFETISYRLPTDTDPVVFGPKYWAAFHDLTNRIPCGTCKEFAVKFMTFFHDLVNLKLKKPLFDPANFAEMSQLVTTVNLKGNRWPAE